MNSADVMRMLHRLSQPEHFMPEPFQSAAPKAPRAPRKTKAPPPPESQSSSDSDGDSDTSSESEYEDLDTIKDKFEKDPCEYVSPGALRATKTQKEAIGYLKAKQCPKIKSVRKSKMDSPKAPGPETAPALVKKVRKAKAAAPSVQTPVALDIPVAPAPAAAAAPVKKVRAKKVVAESLPPVSAPAQGTPLAPSGTPAAGKKRAPTAYALAVGRHRKAGKSFAEAAKAAKAECDAAKAK